MSVISTKVWRFTMVFGSSGLGVELDSRIYNTCTGSTSTINSTIIVRASRYAAGGWAWSAPQAPGAESLGQGSSFVPDL